MLLNNQRNQIISVFVNTASASIPFLKKPWVRRFFFPIRMALKYPAYLISNVEISGWLMLT